MSHFAWLDYSDSERRRVLDVVRSLSEKDTRDELGLATVRDGLADLLAPGISTIQTRARYFLFVPWLYQQLEEDVQKRRGNVTKDWIASRARKKETSLIKELLASEDAAGTIGAWSGKSVQRLPSSVYWNGLREWGIRLSHWSIDAHHHRLAVHGPPSRSSDREWAVLPNWHPGLPLAPEGFPKGATMRLKSKEAEYLAGRILETHPNSLLGQLVLNGDDVSELSAPWEVLDWRMHLTPDVAGVVRHAREFSLAMHGVMLIYNLMLAEAPADPRADWVERYRSLVGDWADEMRACWERFAGWDRADFWRTVERSRPNVPLSSRRFIDSWLDRLLAADDLAALAYDPAVRNLIDNRERELKGSQARLHNPRMLELWNGDTGAGTGRMAYRWDVMRTHLTDIRVALTEPAAVAHA